MMIQEDSFQRFLFEELGIRGEWTHLDCSWRAILERHAYPEAVREQLGQAIAAVLLLSATIKFNGSLILQVHGSGPLHTLVAQATDRRSVRGIAHWRGEVPEGPLSAVFGDGRLVLTVQTESAEPYQGVISLEGNSLAEALETYFSRSEQLATRLWLAADESSAAGLFLQQIPSRQRQHQDWQRVAALADTVTSGELLQLASETLLYRLFHEEQVRLFDPEAVFFRCSCSRERIETVLLAMGRSDMDSVIGEKGVVEVHCEFCNRLYRFDPVDLGALFAGAASVRVTDRRQ